MQKEYKNKNLNRTKIAESLTRIGIQHLSYKPAKSSGHHHLRGSYNDIPFLINVYENKNGSTTLGFTAGQNRELFEMLADAIVEYCVYAEKAGLELSLSHFNTQHLQGLFSYLESENVNVKDSKELSYGGTQARWVGPQGDSIIVKTYRNGTVQFQGKHAHVASLIWDYLYNVLSLEEAIATQSKAYSIEVSVKEICDELAAKIPVAHQFLDESVRKQMSSALMLCKVELPLEDYGAVAFPALRGLEGFIKQVLIDVGLKPGDQPNIGAYFYQVVVGQWKLQAAYESHINDKKPSHIPVLENSYMLYHKQRHGIFHMDATVETSRILGSLEDAKQIVFSIFETIELACKDLCK